VEYTVSSDGNCALQLIPERCLMVKRPARRSILERESINWINQLEKGVMVMRKLPLFCILLAMIVLVTWLSSPPCQASKPLDKNEWMKVNVIDKATGNTIHGVKFLIDYRLDPPNEGDSYTVEGISDLSDPGKIYIALPPEGYPGTLVVRAVKGGVESEPFRISIDEAQRAYYQSGNSGCFLSHTFVMEGAPTASEEAGRYIVQLREGTLREQYEAVGKLSALGDRSAVEPLLELLKSTSDKRMQNMVVDALSNIGDAKAAPVIAKVFAATRLPTALRALVKLGDKETVMPIVLAEVDNGDERLQPEILEALRQWPDPTYLPRLKQSPLMHAENGNTRKTLADLMVRYKDPDAVPYLRKLLKEMSWDYDLAIMLAELGDASGVEVLLKAQFDRFPEGMKDARPGCREALLSLGDKAIPELEKLLESDNERMRNAAREYIKEIGRQE
jgi:HEAT repeat protein